MSFKGIDIRSGTALIFRASIKDSAGMVLATGTTTLMILESQSDGTYKTYDFSDNTFKAGTCTTPTVNMTHRTANNGAVNTGLWTYALGTLTGFTAGNVYKTLVYNSGASPLQQEREFQFGGGQEDISTLATASAMGSPMQAGSAVALAANQDVRNITGTLPDVTLAAIQASYAPAKAGDIASARDAIVAALPIAPDNAGIAAIKGKTDNLPASPAAVGDVTAARDAILDGIPSADLSPVLEAVEAIDARLPAVPASAGDVMAAAGEILAALPDAPPTPMEIAHAVLDEPSDEHRVPGTVGQVIGASGPSIVVPLVTGRQTTVSLVERTMLELKRGDTYRLTFSLGQDYTGWTPHFGARLYDYAGCDLGSIYSMAVRDAVWTDASIGAGYVDITSIDTTSVGAHLAELELRNGMAVNTREEYQIKVIDDVIK